MSKQGIIMLSLSEMRNLEKIKINQIENVYLSKQINRCRNFDSSDIEAYAWEYNKERKKFLIMIACPDTLKL